MRPIPIIRAVCGLLAVALLAACTGGSESTSRSTETASGPVKLTFWSWVPSIDKVVATWNAQHPDIQVSVSKPAQGDELVTKVLTAHKAGNPPDLVQAEYQALPTLVTNGVAADVTEFVVPAEQAFPAGTWNLVTFGGKRYALPQDVGPMMLYYRKDLFDRYGLTVPATWDEFAETARTLREKDPKRYLTTFSSADPGWFAGLAAQAGAAWWSFDGDSWTVAINDAASKRVADYWGGLVAEGVVADKPMYTPDWNTRMNKGTLLAWPSAVWGPGVLSGIAPDTKGKWAMAPLPAWTAGDRRTGFWGGSSTAVSAKSKHREQATRFALWLNTDPAALEALVTQGGIYPAASAGQSVPALGKAPEIMPDATDFYPTVKEISTQATGFTWGPNVNVAYSSYKDAFAKAIKDGTPFSGALETMQKATVADMTKAGFPVSAG
ncbi:MAG: sugar ABC transporter substrate-binding protein [Actinomycetales bacterium]|nr:sugar ABC transporter substrate-binding protein [Actinomycetales bacterium]